MKVEHTSVMLERCITLLAPAIEKSSSPVVVDATLGLGGHSYALLENSHIFASSDLTAISVQSQSRKNVLLRSTIESPLFTRFMTRCHLYSMDLA